MSSPGGSSYADVMARSNEIMKAALGIDYDAFAASPIAFDYEAMMASTGYSLEEIARIQRQVKVGDTTLCEDTTVESNTDDWNGYRESLAKTGATIAGILLAIVAFGAIGVALMGARRRTGVHSGR